jgi:sugar fermentation stimulation protein A
MFFLIQRMDARTFSPADHIDPDYGSKLRQAVQRNVEILVYDTHIDFDGIRLRNRLPHDL